MAEKPSESFQTFERLSLNLAAQTTVTDLFKLATSDEFKAEAATLEPGDLTSLRGVYKSRQQELDGKVKLLDYVGQTLNITDVESWHSSQFDNDGVTIRFHLDDSQVTYKALTSSAPIVRFCSQLDPLPTKDAPVRILLSARPVSDEKRAAQGQKVFSIKRLPSHRGDGTSGSPF